MKIRAMALGAVAASLIAAGGVTLVACSGDDDGTGTPSNNTPDSSVKDTGTSQTDAGTGDQDTSTPETDSSTPPTGACGTGYNGFACEATEDCAGRGGTICCATAPGLPTQKTGCSYYQLSTIQGTSCHTGTECPSGEFRICTVDGDCKTGETCTPFKATALNLGFCSTTPTLDAGTDGGGCKKPPTLHPTDGGALYCLSESCTAPATCCIASTPGADGGFPPPQCK